MTKTREGKGKSHKGATEGQRSKGTKVTIRHGLMRDLAATEGHREGLKRVSRQGAKARRALDLGCRRKGPEGL